MISFFSQPWPWWVAGPVVASVMITLLMLGRTFGVSGSLGTICNIGGAGKLAPMFRYDWKRDIWNLLFVGGTVIGGVIAIWVLPSGQEIALSEGARESFGQMGITNGYDKLGPEALFGAAAWTSWQAWVVWIVGGFALGFGARWAGGCTSGHAITGLSHLQWPSLLAVVGFFGGGLIAAHFILPAFFG
ncbi:MAG: YeeE/YedE family protein [Bacteroidia bacterium]|nr:YeeE/YedE family protein [Bacteroidia bacterium]